MLLDIFNDVFLLNSSFESSKRAFYRFVVLNSNFGHLYFSPPLPQVWPLIATHRDRIRDLRLKAESWSTLRIRKSLLLASRTRQAVYEVFCSDIAGQLRRFT